MRKTMILIMLAMLVGCATPTVIKYGPTYMARNINDNIDVYSASSPDRPFIEIAKITCSGSDNDHNMLQIKNRALEMGADAIILLDEQRTAIVPIGWAYTTYKYGLAAIAIKYKD